jgi:heme-degrading monooxygenase HmoA
MKKPELTLQVRFRSKLPFDELMKIAEERAPEFRALAGLQQKYYLHDPATGEISGLYLWESQEAFDAYRESELRATIAKAYQAEGEPRVEVFRVVKVLRDDRD